MSGCRNAAHMSAIGKLGGLAKNLGPHRLTTERAREMRSKQPNASRDRMRELTERRWATCGRCGRRGPHACFGAVKTFVVARRAR